MKPKYILIKTFENNGETFSAWSMAERFLREKGFDVGSMQRQFPIGFMRNADIAKWTNMTNEERNSLDGFVKPVNSFREGGAEVWVKDGVKYE